MLLLQRETKVLVEDCCDRSYCWTFYINKKIWVDQYYLTQSYQCLLYIVMRLNYVMRLLFFGCNRSKRREYQLTEMSPHLNTVYGLRAMHFIFCPNEDEFRLTRQGLESRYQPPDEHTTIQQLHRKRALMYTLINFHFSNMMQKFKKIDIFSKTWLRLSSHLCCLDFVFGV